MLTMPPPTVSSSPDLGSDLMWTLCVPSSVPFPSRLHAMLQSAEQMGLTDIVSWLPHGRAFKIHDPDEFMARVASKFFTATKIRSIHRQLNLWGFQRIAKGADKDGWFHESFLRGRPGLTKNIIRTKIKGKNLVQPAPVVPNFYQMPPILLGQDEEGESHASSRLDPQGDDAKSMENDPERPGAFVGEGNRADAAVKEFLEGYSEASQKNLESQQTKLSTDPQGDGAESTENDCKNLEAFAKEGNIPDAVTKECLDGYSEASQKLLESQQTKQTSLFEIAAMLQMKNPPILSGQDEGGNHANSGPDPQGSGAKPMETHSNPHGAFAKEGSRADAAMKEFLEGYAQGYSEASHKFLERAAALQAENNFLSDEVANLKATAAALEVANEKRQNARTPETEQVLREKEGEAEKLKSDHARNLEDARRDHEAAMKKTVEELTYRIYQEKANVFLRDGQIKDMQEEIDRRQKEIDLLRKGGERAEKILDNECEKTTGSTEDTGKPRAEAGGRDDAGNGGTVSRVSAMEERLVIEREKTIARLMEQRSKLNMSQLPGQQEQATNGECQNNKMQQCAAALQMMASGGVRASGAWNASRLIDSMRGMNNSARAPFFSMPQQQAQQQHGGNSFQLSNGNSFQHNNSGNCYPPRNGY